MPVAVSFRRFFLVEVVLCTISLAQASPPQNQQPMGTSGSSTAGVHTAIYDAQQRPITAGGFVKSGPVIFQDISNATPPYMRVRTGRFGGLS